MVFDLRTRTADDMEDLEFGRCREMLLPALLEQHRDVATTAWRFTGLPAFTLAVDGVATTWRAGDDGALEVVAGDDGRGPRADLSTLEFSQLWTDVRSAMGVMMTGAPVMTRGAIGHLVAFDLVLRAVVDGRPTYDAGSVPLVDRNGTPLDLDRTFTLDDDPQELRGHLAAAGHLVVRGVVGAADVATLDAELHSWLGALEPDDPRAWFASVGGRGVCVRATNLRPDELSTPHDELLAPLAAMIDPSYRYASTDLLRKPVGVTEGLSDLPWHRDCDPGGHSYRCASLTMGLSLTPSGPDNGQLGVVAGSHRANMTLFDLDRVDLPRHHLSTEPGDVTVHLSCALHCATPPRHSERRVSYSSFQLPGHTDELDEVFRAARDAAARATYAPT